MKRMAKILLLILFGVTVVFLVFSRNDQTRNLDPTAGFNGSFESVQNGYPVNWSFFPDPETTDSYQVALDSVDVKEGSRSLKIEINANGTIPGFRSRRIAVQPGKEYRLSMSIKSVGCGLKVNRIIQDKSGKTNKRADDIVEVRNPTGTWQQYEETLVIAKGESYVVLIFEIYDTGTLWCDDIRLEER